jgi:hypothetical protein
VPVGSTPYAKNPESAELVEVHKKAMRARPHRGTKECRRWKNVPKLLAPYVYSLQESHVPTKINACSDRACYVHNT